jgi:surface polysaccharide O-acyltransferase-like enzyme
VADMMFCLSKVAVPIFLLLSGALLLNKKEENKAWIKRILHIIVLIVGWAIIYKCENTNKYQLIFYFFYIFIGFYYVIS